MIRTLREFISFAQEEGLLLNVKESVHAEDLPELIEYLLCEGKIILFENIKSYQCKVITNLVPSHDIFKKIFNTQDPYSVFLDRVNQKGRLIKCNPEAEYSLIATEGRDLTEIIPVLTHYEQDSAPFITTGMVSAVDPHSNIVARGIHRLGWRGRNRFGIALLNPPLKDVYPKYVQMGKDMPVSVIIGVDPILFLSMALKVSPNIDKLEVAASLKGGELYIMESPKNKIPIPFEPEFIMEGYVSCKEMEPDGTLGEISGYPLTFGETPTLYVTSLYYKPTPIYHALLPTSSEADNYLTFVSRAHFGNDVKRLFPFVVDILLVRKTFGASAIISVKEVEKELIRNLILFCLSFPMIKKVVVVDTDIDIRDLNHVEWAIITRCRFDQDVIMVSGLKGQPIDPSAYKDFGVSKIGFNATVKGKSIQNRVSVKKGNKERIEVILSKLGVKNE